MTTQKVSAMIKPVTQGDQRKKRKEEPSHERKEESSYERKGIAIKQKGRRFNKTKRE